MSGVATFEFRSISRELLTTAAVAGVTAVKSFMMPVDVGAGTDTGIALADVSPTSPINVRLRMIDESGLEVGSATHPGLNALVA